MTRLLLRLCLLTLLLAMPAASAFASERADATLVLFNSSDPLSETLAGYYAERRGIPPERVVGLDCPMTEEITREEYDTTIAQPLRELFSQRDWWTLTSGDNPAVLRNKIRFIALIRGMPLKIAHVDAYPGDTEAGADALRGRNEASVDSELAALGFHTRYISGAHRNPYFRSFSPILDAGQPALMLVGRLDAPTGKAVRRMIDDALTAERDGLWGIAYIDIRGLKSGAHLEGDEWLRSIADNASKSGIPVVTGHGSSLFPESYPMQHAAFYYGWYTRNVSGPFVREDFSFAPGAVACHIHSFSASTLREPRTGWAGPLTLAGAAAVLGNVYEPYLGLTTRLDLFHERLMAGFTFAESAYMATPALSWMPTFIGDPLYRPMRLVNDLLANPPENAREWSEYRKGTRAWAESGINAGRKELQDAAHRMKSGVLFEGLASLEVAAGNSDAALEMSRKARENYADPADAIRVIYREANLLAGLKRKREALELLRASIEKYRAHPRSAALHELRDELDPPPPPKPAATPASR